MPFPSQRRDHAGPSEFTSSPKRIAVLYYCPGYLLYDGEVSTRAVSSTTSTTPVDLVGVQLVIVLDTTGSMGSVFNVCWPLISNARTGEKAKEISKSQIPIFPNFLGLVLGCIEAKFCK